jgi:hypothetical protein
MSLFTKKEKKMKRKLKLYERKEKQKRNDKIRTSFPANFSAIWPLLLALGEPFRVLSIGMPRGDALVVCPFLQKNERGKEQEA